MYRLKNDNAIPGGTFSGVEEDYLWDMCICPGTWNKVQVIENRKLWSVMCAASVLVGHSLAFGGLLLLVVGVGGEDQELCPLQMKSSGVSFLLICIASVLFPFFWEIFLKIVNNDTFPLEDQPMLSHLVPHLLLAVDKGRNSSYTHVNQHERKKCWN